MDPGKEGVLAQLQNLTKEQHGDHHAGKKVTNSKPSKCFKFVSAAKCKNVVADYKRKTQEDIKLK